MKIVILIYQIIPEKFAYGKLFMLVMKGYIFMYKMVKKIKNSGLEIIAGCYAENASLPQMRAFDIITLFRQR